MVSDAASRILEQSLQTGILTLEADSNGRYRSAYFEGNDEELFLTDTSVGDELVEYLQTLPNLRTLGVSGTKFTDDAVARLASSRTWTMLAHDW